MDSLTISGASESSVKIRLIGHCIICLRKLSTGAAEEEEGTTEKREVQDYPEAVPTSVVSTPEFLGTFHEIWGYLQQQNGSESKSNGGGVNGDGRKGRSISSFGIALERVVAAGSQINVTFSRTPSPTICHQCFNKTLAVENMMKVVRHQVRDIERLVKESRKGGKFGGRAEQIQKTLQVFTLEVDDRGAVDEEDDDDEVHLNLEEENSDNNCSFERQKSKVDVEEKPKRKRGRPPRARANPVISEDSLDSTGQEDKSMDYSQHDDHTINCEDKEDPDFQIKVEPRSSDEEDDDVDDNGSNFSDELLVAGSSAKSLRSSGIRGSSSSLSNKTPAKTDSFKFGSSGQKIKWQTIDLTDEEITREWRLRTKTVQKSGTVLEYYCAHGKFCRAKVKNKILKNGTSLITTNGLEHCNHREKDKSFGLTVEQKEFIQGCVDAGVNKPSVILLSFKAKGVEIPRKKQVCCWLKRINRNEKKNSKSVKGQSEKCQGGINEGDGEKRDEDNDIT